MSDYRNDPRWQDALRRADRPKGTRTASDALFDRLAATHEMFLIECEYEGASA